MASSGRPIDPLDVKQPTRLAWEVFRANYAAVMLIHWLFRDLRYLKPDYASDLWNRFETGLAYKKRFEDGQYDGHVPVHTPDWDGVDFWIRYEDLEDLYDSLYPHHARRSPPYDLGRGLVVIGLHNAFEAYAKALGVSAKGALPDAVLAFLTTRATGYALDVETFEALADLDATRHVLVHNRGAVDERYVRAVRNSTFVIGETRLLTDHDVDRFAWAARAVAQIINSGVGAT